MIIQFMSLTSSAYAGRMNLFEWSIMRCFYWSSSWLI